MMTISAAPADDRAHSWRWMGATVALTGLAAFGALALNRRFYFFDDTQIGAFWNWHELGTSLRDGRWPMLDPSRWMGGNIGAEGQWGVWNPLVLLIGLGASVTTNAALYSTAVKVVFLVVAATGTHLLVRDRGVPAPIACVAGVAVTLTGFTVYMDAASWVTGLMTWAMLPWAWLALVRLGDGRGGVVAAFGAGYLLVAVGYVHGALMLAFTFAGVIVARLVDGDRRGAGRVLGVGVLVGLVVVTVYLPGIGTAEVTARSNDGVLNSDFLSTDVAGLVSSVSSEARSVLPGWWASNYAPVPLLYLAWFLPVLAFVDWSAGRRLLRRHVDLLIVLAVATALVLGPTDIGPLRLPVRLMPYVSLAGLALVAILLTNALARPVSRVRLLAATAWVVIAAYLAWAGRPDTLGRVALAGGVAVAGLVITRWLIGRGDGGVRWAPVAFGLLAVSLVTSAIQRVEYDHSPLPDFGLTPRVDALRDVQPAAVSDAVLVGSFTDHLEVGHDAPVWSEALLGGSWFGADVDVQNVYTAIAFREYSDVTCMNFRGETCPGLLARLFRPQPTTGLDLADQLAINSVIMFKDEVGATWRRPPAGWTLAADGALTATWVRAEPGPRAGGVVWQSPGVTVRELGRGDTEVRLAVEDVPAGGGVVVLSRLAWPGYEATNAAVGEPTDGYLLTIEVPSDATGQTVTIRFRPPGWRLEVAALIVALLGCVAWAVTDSVRRRWSSQPGAPAQPPVDE